MPPSSIALASDALLLLSIWQSRRPLHCSPSLILARPCGHDQDDDDDDDADAVFRSRSLEPGLRQAQMPVSLQQYVKVYLGPTLRVTLRCHSLNVLVMTIASHGLSSSLHARNAYNGVVTDMENLCSPFGTECWR